MAKRRWARLLLSVGAPFAVILALFVGGDLTERVASYRGLRQDPGRPAADTLGRLRAELGRPFLSPLDSGLPVYDLRIGPKQLRRLHEAADLVQARGNAQGLVMPDYERAHFLREGQWVPIRVKLRGWTANHFNKSYPSLRLRFPANNLIGGLRQINLVDPYDKFISGDVTTGREAGRRGLLLWQHRFVVLRVNGEVWGPYLEIEQPGRELLEAGGRSEGPIFSPNGTLYGSIAPGYEKGRQALQLVEACADPLAPATHCTWGFVQGVFDTDRLAWAAAIMGLGGHWGAWLEDNLRFYFDPTRGRFEPIPWDYGFYRLSEEPIDWSGFPGWRPDGMWSADGEDLARLGVTLLGLAEFRQLRDERLWQLVTTRIEPMVQEAEAVFRSVEPAFRGDRRAFGSGAARRLHEEFVETLRANAALLQRLFTANAVTVAFTLPKAPGEQARLQIENHGKASVDVAQVQFAMGGATHEHYLQPPVRVPGRWQGRPGALGLSIPLPTSAEVRGIDARNAVTGEQLRSDDVRLEQRPSLLVPSPPPAGQQFDPAIAGIAVEKGLVRFGPGRVVLRQTLEVPEGYNTRFEPGLDLRLAQATSLILRGNLESIGTTARPVRVRGLDGVGPWGTLAVLGQRVSPSRVVLEHTIIEGGSEAETDRVIFTGAFAVHDGDVTLVRSQFLNARGEDGINLKHARVDLRHVLIRGTFSDAIDFDFCQGRMTSSVIEDAGGDGIDLSGSNVTLEDNRIRRTGDKGISVGERTVITVRRSALTGSTTGIAVKDGSKATIVDCRITDQQVGVSAYVKKPSFGGSSATVDRVLIEHVATRFLKDKDCEILENGRSQR